MQPLKKKRQQASPPKSECKVKTKCLINKKITQKKLSSPFFSPLFLLSIPPFSPSMSFLPRVECAATPSPPPPFPLPPVRCAATPSQHTSFLPSRRVCCDSVAAPLPLLPSSLFLSSFLLFPPFLSSSSPQIPPPRIQPPSPPIRKVPLMSISLTLKSDVIVSPFGVKPIHHQPHQPLHPIPHIKQHKPHLPLLQRVNQFMIQFLHTHLPPASLHKHDAEEVDAVKIARREMTRINNLHDKTEK